MDTGKHVWLRFEWALGKQLRAGTTVRRPRQARQDPGVQATSLTCLTNLGRALGFGPSLLWNYERPLEIPYVGHLCAA